MTSAEKNTKTKKPPQLTSAEITKLKQLISNDENFKTLITVSNKWSYITEYILKESYDIKIIETEGKPDKTTTVKMYDSTLTKWQEYTQKHHQIKSAELLNTALLEYMERHP